MDASIPGENYFLENRQRFSKRCRESSKVSSSLSEPAKNFSVSLLRSRLLTTVEDIGLFAGAKRDAKRPRRACYEVSRIRDEVSQQTGHSCCHVF